MPNRSAGLRIVFLLAVMACLAATSAALAQSYPSKPVRMIVPYPAGGGTDIAARWICQKLSERFNQQVIVDNRAGANGNLGTQSVARAAPDGYVIGMATPGPVTVGPSLYRDLPYDPQKASAFNPDRWPGPFFVCAE